MTKFSIIIPVYNVENEIRQCLDSIQNQTFGDFEVLMVDDCGTDSSADIANEYAQKDPRFKLIRHEHNRGVSVARNTALEQVQGEYLVFVDADDWIELNELEVLNEAFEKSKLDLVWFGSYMFRDGKQEPPPENQPEHVEYVTNSKLMRMVGCIWNKAYRMSFIREHGIKFPEGIVIEDSEFTFRTSIHAKRVYYIPDVLYNYRVNREGSITTEDKIGTRICDEFVIINRMYDYLKETNLFNEYKLYLVEYLGVIIRKILFLKHERHYIIKQAHDLMVRMNFPNDFADLEQNLRINFN